MSLVVKYIFGIIFIGLLAGCASSGNSERSKILIDQHATAQAPWKVGEIIAQNDESIKEELAFQRRFLGVTNQEYYLVQDFWGDSDKKMTDPYVLMKKEDLAVKYYVDCFGFSLIGFVQTVAIEGAYTGWWGDGTTIMLKAHFLNGKLHGKLWFNDVFPEENNFEIEYVNGEMSGMCRELDKAGNVLEEESCSEVFK